MYPVAIGQKFTRHLRGRFIPLKAANFYLNAFISKYFSSFFNNNSGESRGMRVFDIFSSFLQRSATQKKFKQTKEKLNEKVRYLTLGEKINSFSEGALPKRNFNKLEINKQES